MDSLFRLMARLGAETSQNAPAAISESPKGVQISNRVLHGYGRSKRHSESSANLLSDIDVNFCNFSECALISLKPLPDFDSTIRRFEPSRPSQPVRQLEIVHS